MSTNFQPTPINPRKNPMNTNTESSLFWKLITFFLLSALFIGVSLVSYIATAGAQENFDVCNGIEVDFTGTKLLNQDGSTISGPRVVNLEAGTYNVTLVSSDITHETFPDHGPQPNEQWFLVWDDGFRVGPSADIADDVIVNSTTFFNVEAPGTVELYAVHAQIGDNINSVDPLSACLEVRVEEPVEEPTPTTEEPVEEPVEPAPTTIPEEPAEPTTTTVPDTQVGDPVEPVVPAETPAEEPQLALTGPRDDLIAFGVGLTLIGSLIVGMSSLLRRREA